MCEKKVLFLGTALNYSNASSITVSNLFSHWPKRNLIIAASYEQANLSLMLGYNNVYSLGKKELFYKLKSIKTYSGPLTRIVKTKFKITSLGPNLNPKQSKKITSHKRWFTNIIITTLNFLGVNFCLYQMRLSKELKQWILENDPDYIYTQLSSRASILFALKIYEAFQKPIIIHIMDDWPTTIVGASLLSFYWRKKIDKEFRELLSVSYQNIAISEKMAVVYQKRYGGSWSYYHNPIDTERWLPFQKNNHALGNTIKIGYFGRIGRANSTTLHKSIKAVEKISEIKIELHIYSQIHSKDRNNIFYHPFVEHSRIPEVVSSFDLLLLPLGFSKGDVKFAKYSIPTKASEYMISGVPIILIAPDGMALTEFFEKHQCGLIINSDNPKLIKESLLNFIENQDQRELFSNNAIQVAQKLFDINTIHESFKKIFS